MRHTAALVLMVMFTAGCRSVPPSDGTDSPVVDSFAVVAEADRLAERDLWPGFNPHEVPVAIFDGQRTLLFRHSNPPEGFEPVAGIDDVRAFGGRHPSVVANSSTEIGNIQTATLRLDVGTGPLRSRAAVLLHETFHVYQRERHPSWSANEVELFTYPVDDPLLFKRSQLEIEALRRALDSPAGSDGSACWSRVALDVRRQRFALMPEGSVAYERMTELNEGLATYIEMLAAEAADNALISAEGFEPDAVRHRGYRTGAALGRLLDRFAPTWKNELESNDSSTLDALLANALSRRASGTTPCSFTQAELDDVESRAVESVVRLQGRRARQRDEFLKHPGWSLMVQAAADSPLFPQGFDPLNVHTVARGEVLHSRFLKLGNQNGEIEVQGRASLTQAAGDHPLFNGVRSLMITGLDQAPSIAESNDGIVIKADGRVTATLKGAVVQRSDRMVTITLEPVP